MAAPLNLSLQGDELLRRLMETLPGRVLRKCLRSALGAAATPIVSEARANAPQQAGGGIVRKSISKKIGLKGGSAFVVIGAKRGVSGQVKKHKVTASRILHLIEKGTQPHVVKQGATTFRQELHRLKGGNKQHPGAKANRFLENAFEAHRDEALSVASEKLGDMIEKEAAKRD